MDKVDYSPAERYGSLFYNGKGYRICHGGGYWTLYADPDMEYHVSTLADTIYRKRIAWGLESLSGGTLPSNTSARGRNEYKASAQAFIDKLRRMGVKCTEVRGGRGARILLIG